MGKHLDKGLNGTPLIIGAPLPDHFLRVGREDKTLEHVLGDSLVIQSGAPGSIVWGMLPLDAFELGGG